MKSYWELLEEAIKNDVKLREYLFAEIGEQIDLYFGNYKMLPKMEQIREAKDIVETLRLKKVQILNREYIKGKAAAWLVPLLFYQQKFRIKVLILVEDIALILNLQEEMQEISSKMSYSPQMKIMTDTYSYMNCRDDEVLITTRQLWESLTVGLSLEDYMRHKDVNIVIVK